MNEKMNFDLNDVKEVFNRIIDEAVNEVNKARAQKERCKCKEEGPNSVENRLMAVEAKQDLIIEDLNLISKSLNNLNQRVEDIEDELRYSSDEDKDDYPDCDYPDDDYPDCCDDCDCGCDCECDSDDDKVDDYICSILDIFEESSDDDEDDDEDYDEEELMDFIEVTKEKIKKYFKGTPIVFAYDGKSRTYVGF